MSRANTAIAARMRELSGPGLYRRNLFRLSGLPTDATSADIRRRRWLVEDDLETARALDELNDPQRRVVDELFWLWETGDDAAGCHCPSTLHRDHDVAVRAHARALGVIIPDLPDGDPPAGESGEPAATVRRNDPCSCGSGLKYRQCHGAAPRSGPAKNPWLEAAEAWSGLLRRAAFWEHVRSRIQALDDRRLDDSAIETLRSGLPRALVAPQLEHAARAIDPKPVTRFLDYWDLGGTVVSDLVEEAAAPLYRRVEEVMRDAADKLGDDDPRAAAALLTGAATEGLGKLEVLHPHDRHHRAASVRDQLASLLSSTAMAMVDPARPAQPVTTKLFTAATKLAVTEQTRTSIRKNRKEVEKLTFLNADLMEFGLTASDDWPAVISARLDRLLSGGQYAEALRLLAFLRRHISEPVQAAQIDALMQNVRTAMSTGQRLVQQPLAAPRDPVKERYERRYARKQAREERKRSDRQTPVPEPTGPAPVPGARPVIRGGPADGANGHDFYRLTRQIFDPVRQPGVVFGTGTVREWADRVKQAGDEKHIYLLLQVWWLVTTDPEEKAQIYLYICEIWQRTNMGQRPLRGARWGLALLSGAAAVYFAWTHWGVLWALLVLVLGVALAAVVALAVLGRGMRKISEYFPDFVQEMVVGLRR